MYKTILTFFVTPLTIGAATLEFQVEGVVDNREYFNQYEEPGTTFGLRERALGTFDFKEQSLTVGAIWFQRFGSPLEEWPVTPILFYEYHGDHHGRLLFGVFPRLGNVLHSPILMDNRYDLDRPQVEGFDFRFTFPVGMISAWVDWDGLQSETRHEQFMFGFSGQERLGKFGVDHHFLYRHYASRAVVPTDPVGESGGGHLSIFYEDNDLPALDTLKISADLIGSYNRSGREEWWNVPIGAQLSGRAIFHRLGIGGLYYQGIYQSINWHQLEFGAPFYNAPQFGKVDLCFYPIKKERIAMSFHWGVTFVDQIVENEQRFTFTGKLGR